MLGMKVKLNENVLFFLGKSIDILIDAKLALSPWLC